MKKNNRIDKVLLSSLIAAGSLAPNIQMVNAAPSPAPATTTPEFTINRVVKMGPVITLPDGTKLNEIHLEGWLPSHLRGWVNENNADFVNNNTAMAESYKRSIKENAQFLSDYANELGTNPFSLTGINNPADGKAVTNWYIGNNKVKTIGEDGSVTNDLTTTTAIAEGNTITFNTVIQGSPVMVERNLGRYQDLNNALKGKWTTTDYDETFALKNPDQIMLPLSAIVNDYFTIELDDAQVNQLRNEYKLNGVKWKYVIKKGTNEREVTKGTMTNDGKIALDNKVIVPEEKYVSNDSETGKIEISYDGSFNYVLQPKSNGQNIADPVECSGATRTEALTACKAKIKPNLTKDANAYNTNPDNVTFGAGDGETVEVNYAKEPKVGVEEEEYVIPFETVREDDATAFVGTETVKQEGKNGTGVRTYKTIDGVRQPNPTEKVKKAPVNKIIGVGTKEHVTTTEVERVPIPFNTVREDDPTAFVGTETVKQEGKNGEIIKTYKVVDGVRTGDVEETRVEPVDKIISVGTKEKIKYNLEEKHYTRTFNFKNAILKGNKLSYKFGEKSTSAGDNAYVMAQKTPDGAIDGYEKIDKKAHKFNKFTLPDVQEGYVLWNVDTKKPQDVMEFETKDFTNKDVADNAPESETYNFILLEEGAPFEKEFIFNFVDFSQSYIT